MLFRIINLITDKFKILEPGTEVFTGKSNLSSNGPTERVVWYLENDSYGPSHNLGQNPKQAFSRDALVSFCLFAGSPERIDSLINSMAVAIKWIMNEDGLELSGEMIDLGVEAVNGFGYKLDAVISTVIAEPMYPVGIVKSEVITTQFQIT